MKRLMTAFAAALASFALAGQTGIEVQAPNLVAADEQFNVTFSIEGEHKVSSFSWEPGSDFKLVWGPQKGSSTSISIVNGKRSTSVQTSYTYVLMPKAAGKFTLPVATARVNGDEIYSSPFTIEVVSGGGSSSSSAQQQSQSSSPQQQSSATGTVSSEDIYLKMVLSKSNVVIGEPVSASLKLYQRVGVAGFEDARFPTFDGFWSQETYTPTNIEFKRENVGDRIFNTAVLRTWTLIPQRSGDLKIEPSELVCLVNVRVQRAPTGSIFDSFFQDEYQTVRKRLTTPQLRVRVSALPAGAPASFCGGVGSFKMDVSLSKDSLTVHDAASLLVKVTGTGNVALLEAPKINFPPDFELYDVKATDIAGGKSFEFPFIPRAAGHFDLPAVEYSYYDIKAGRYATLRGRDLTIDVGKGSGMQAYTSSPSAVSAPASRKDVKNLASDIRYIDVAAPSFSLGSRYFVGTFAFWLVVLGMAALSALYYALMRKRSIRRADVAGSRKRAATKMARKRLSVAGKYLDEGLQTAFYESLHKALLGFASDKLNMDMTDMTAENIESQFTGCGVTAQTASEFSSLLQACEYARYSPSSDAGEMKALYEKAVDAVSAIDGSMKPARRGKGVLPVVAALLVTLSPSLAVDSSAQSADSLWNAGVSLYGSGNWKEASDCWLKLIEAGYTSARIYYNLGNAAFKDNDYAHSVLYYERALKADPSLDDARFNLDFVNAHLVDRVEAVPEFFLVKWTRGVSYLMSPDAWTVAGLLLFALCLVALLLFALSASTSLRKTGFFGAIAAFVLSVVCVCFAFSQKADYDSADRAVVMSPVSSVKSAPGASSVDLFVLHEGTVVKTGERAGDWSEVELADGRQGWMRAGDFETI